MGSRPNAHLGYEFRLSDDDQDRFEDLFFSEKEALQIQYGIDFEVSGYEDGPTFVLISTLHYSVDWDNESVIIKMQNHDAPDWHLFTYYG